MSEQFCLALAGVPIEVTVLHSSTRRFCAEYLTEQLPRISVEITQEDIEIEREKSAQEDLRCSIPIRHFSDDYLETLALYRRIVEALLMHDVLLFHGALIEKDGEGILFTAPSGTGKTTHIRLWQQVFGEAVTVINGDKPLLRFTSEGVFACGTPWQGKENLGTNKQVPLRAICYLERAGNNHIETISMLQALPTLMQQTYRFYHPEQVRRMMQLLSRLETVNQYRLGCNMQPEAAMVAERGILHEQF